MEREKAKKERNKLPDTRRENRGEALRGEPGKAIRERI